MMSRLWTLLCFLTLGGRYATVGDTEESSLLVRHTLDQAHLRHQQTKHVTKCGHRMMMGVDYYPEQWPLDEMEADMTSIKQDLGADFIRVAEFMWHILEPQDGVFNFTLLDAVVETAERLGLEVMIGTPTATAPAWLYTAHPDIFAKGPDAAEGFQGSTPAFGGRRQCSFSSDVYVRYSKRIVERLAERYGAHSSVTVWQIDNEVGNEQSDLDFSDAARGAWHTWLIKKYHGDIRKLNEAWGTVFWSTTYDNFEQIPLPVFTRPGGSLQGTEEFRSNMSPGLLLDYRRFRADTLADFIGMQAQILRAHNVKGCLSTNINGGFWGRAMDNNAINEHLDFPGYDNYPVWGGSLAPDTPAKVAMTLDTVRGWAPSKDRTAGFMVPEQLIGAQGHDIIGYTPRPDQIVAWSAQTLLHGATSLAFFRYRAAVTGQEMFCYGILDHTTPRGTGRKFQEAKKVYNLARAHDSLWLGTLAPRVALLYSIDSIFSWNAQPQSTAFDYSAEALRMYYPFWRNGAGIDVVTMQRVLDACGSPEEMLAKYSIVLLPAPIIVSEKFATLLEGYVKLGGIAWIGFRADVKDETNAMRRSASRLANLAGVEVSEIESLNTPLTTMLKSNGGAGNLTSASVWRDGLQIIAGSGAEALWSYTDKFFGSLALAAVTRRKFSSVGGEVVYIGTGIDQEALVSLATDALTSKKVQHVGVSQTDQVEQQLRSDAEGKSWRVAINYGEDASIANDGTVLEPYKVSIEPFAG
eukprot:TRINITY_DN63452_c0_g1_i1.p1 TRINITY_DN63452_c0_g1~~TRINITY_DN63452_c0_g1_i1.p1  ORF type:complete len:769 (-),score=93.70 TRINITY_DN63452_c0_g1_i1:186-2432(-)